MFFPFLCSVVLQTIALLPPTGLVACLQTKDRKRYYRRVVTYHSTLLVAFNYVFSNLKWSNRLDVLHIFIKSLSCFHVQSLKYWTDTISIFLLWFLISLPFSPPSLLFFFFFSLFTQFTEATQWLAGSPGVASALQIGCLEVAELSDAVEGDSTWSNINISHHWFSDVWPNMTQYRANWLMSVGPRLRFLPVLVTDAVTETLFHCSDRQWSDEQNDFVFHVCRRLENMTWSHKCLLQ